MAGTETADAVDKWQGTVEMGGLEAIQLAEDIAAGIDRMTMLVVGILERLHIAEHSIADRQQHCNLYFVDGPSAGRSLLPAVGMLWPADRGIESVHRGQAIWQPSRLVSPQNSKIRIDCSLDRTIQRRIMNMKTAEKGKLLDRRKYCVKALKCMVC